MKKLSLTILVIILSVFAVISGVDADGLPLPFVIGGTVTINGVQITQATDDDLLITVTKNDGTDYTNANNEHPHSDGLNTSNFYLIDVPIFSAAHQSGGANTGDTAWLHIFKTGTELFITGSSPGAITIGASGTISQIDIVSQASLSVIPVSRNVAKDAGTTTFSLSNIGASTSSMPWTAAVTSGNSWLQIQSGVIGTDTGTITCAFSANTDTSARTGTLRVTATGGATGTPVDITVIQAPTTVQPVLSVSPTNRDVAKDAGTTTFSVSNIGTGTMPWTAAVISGSSWLSITSGVSGTDTGTITCSFNANTGTSARTGTIRVTATDATGTPKDVIVTQAGTPDPGPGPGPGPSPEPELMLSPSNRDVAKDTGTTTFSVSNTGTGTMPWSATVPSGSSWLSITSGTSGTDSGTINCSYTANTSTSSRTGTIRIIASGASGSPVDVTVTQVNASQLVLMVNPGSRAVASTPGATTFSVSNTGTGTMVWVSQITSGSSWLNITSGTSGSNTGTITCAFDANTATESRTGTIRVTATGATGSPKDVTVTQAGSTKLGSNSIDAVDVVKITDMSGLLPDGGGAVTVRAWDKDGKQLTASGYALPLSIINHGTTSILGADLKGRFPDGTPAAYTFSVDSSKMFITNINNSIDGAVKVPIIYSNGLSNFVSNSTGSRNTIKVTDMSGAIVSGGIAIAVTAWDASGNAIPESTSAAPLKLYNHGTTIIAGSTLAERFSSGAMAYEFTIASPKLVITNVKGRSDGTLNVPSVYTTGVSNFVSNSIGSRNTLYISDLSGTLDIGGAAVSVRAWDVLGNEIPNSESVGSYTVSNYETLKITGSELASRFPSGVPMAYEFTVGSSKVVITSVKSSSDGSINIPTVYTSGITNYTTNYVGDLNTIQITDMSGGISAGKAGITITARDVDGNIIPESGGASPLKLNNNGTTTIKGADLQNRFSGGVPVTYEFTIGSSSAVVTNLTESSDGTINIPTVFTIGPYGGI